MSNLFPRKCGQKDIFSRVVNNFTLNWAFLNDLYSVIGIYTFRQSGPTLLASKHIQLFSNIKTKVKKSSWERLSIKLNNEWA